MADDNSNDSQYSYSDATQLPPEQAQGLGGVEAEKRPAPADNSSTQVSLPLPVQAQLSAHQPEAPQAYQQTLAPQNHYQQPQASQVQPSAQQPQASHIPQIPQPSHTQQSYQQQQQQQQAYQQAHAQQNQQQQPQGHNPYGQQSSQHLPQVAQYAPAPPQKRVGKGASFLIGLLGVLVGAALSMGALYTATSGFSFSGAVDTSSIVINAAGEDTELAVAVAAKVTPSVVNIDVFATTQPNSLEDFLGGSSDSSDGGSDSIEQTGLGSGVILTSDGYILTNYHVVEGGERFLVSLDNEELEATIVDTDVFSDLAVIKVDATGLTPIEIGDSDAVQVGEWVMAVGSPYGLEKSVSTGIVSALYRSTALQSQSDITIYANLIQTDAAINPGNSGGALVNSAGELIGINTLINSASGSSAGVGFAIPSNYAFNIAEQLMSGKGVAHPYLGVTLYSVDAATAEQLQLSVQSGAYVDSVQSDSPAERAGLETGDVITSIANKNINTSAELIIEIRQHDIGETVKLGINRGGQTKTIEVVLGSTTS